MVDLDKPEEVEALLVRVQARRVAQCYQGAGKIIPPRSAGILADAPSRRWIGTQRPILNGANAEASTVYAC